MDQKWLYKPKCFQGFQEMGPSWAKSSPQLVILPSSGPSHFSFRSDGLPVELCHALDESEEGSIAVNLLPVLLASRNNASSKDKSDR